MGMALSVLRTGNSAPFDMMIATITPKMPSAEPKISTISTLRRRATAKRRGGVSAAMKRNTRALPYPLNKKRRVLCVGERAARASNALREGGSGQAMS